MEQFLAHLLFTHKKHSRSTIHMCKIKLFSDKISFTNAWDINETKKQIKLAITFTYRK